MRAAHTNQLAIGATVALAVITLLEASALVLPRLDSPPPILTVPVVVAAYLGAVRGGLACAALLFAYTVIVWWFLPDGSGRGDEVALRTVALGFGLPLAGGLVGYLREKSDRRLRALRASESRLQEAMHFRDRILDQSMDMICTIDGDGRFTLVSAASERILGFRPDELVGRPYLDFVHPEDRGRTTDVAENIAAGTHTLNFVNRYITKDGSVVHMMWSACWSAEDNLNFCIARDYSDQKKVDDERARFMSVIEATTDLVGISRPDGRLSHLNGAGKGLLGLDADAPVEHLDIADLTVAGTERATMDDAVATAIEDGVWIGESALLTPDRQLVPVSQILLSHRRSDGALEFLSTIVRDISAIKALEARLREEATTDELSGLSNRRHFLERFRAAIFTATRHQHPLSFAFIDLDEFKRVNDLHGHAAGDEVIRGVAQILRAEMRGDDLACRFGGDEFWAMLPYSTSSDAAICLERIRDRVAAVAIDVGTVRLKTSVSVGIAELGELDAPSATAEQLMAMADRALFAAKLAGRNQIQVAIGA